jgi:lipoprotein-anchoring transpeptidase ErfK/SrfK
MNIKSLTLYSVALLGAEYLLFGVFGLVLLFGPGFVSLVDASAPAPKQEEILWAPVHLPKPSTAPTQVVVVPSPQVASPTEPPAPIVDSLDAAPVISAEPTPDDPAPNDGRWIDVNLSEQKLYAYEGDVVVNTFIVSTGVYDTPTVTGQFNIYVKVPMQDMSGPGYYLSSVPWVMFFYDEYGFHGTYWHDNFGTPMSRGCVNLRTEDAEWLYHWASVGTPVGVHY